jgi:hypothetical protein
MTNKYLMYLDKFAGSPIKDFTRIKNNPLLEYPMIWKNFSAKGYVTGE